MGTGRGDFPNQVNNSLGFPAIFRGTLDLQAQKITDEMALDAAQELSRYAQERGTHAGNIVPRMDEWEVYPRDAAAAGITAQEQGIARLSKTWQQLHDHAAKMIREAREAIQLLMKERYIVGHPTPAGFTADVPTLAAVASSPPAGILEQIWQSTAIDPSR